MAVGEGESTGTVVIRCRDILPGRGAGIVDEVTVVDGVRMLIEEQPGFCSPRNLRLLQILPVLRETPISASACAIKTRAKAAKNRIHRKASISARKTGGTL